LLKRFLSMVNEGSASLNHAATAILGAVGVAFGSNAPAPPSPTCAPIPRYENGAVAGRVCREMAGEYHGAVLDLGDDWAPQLFSETAEHPQR
jgi:hypothetical protein